MSTIQGEERLRGKRKAPASGSGSGGGITTAAQYIARGGSVTGNTIVAANNVVGG